MLPGNKRVARQQTGWPLRKKTKVAAAQQKAQPGAVPLPKLHDVRALLLDLDDTILDNRSGSVRAWTAAVEFAVVEHPDLDADALGSAIAAETGRFWSDPDRERRGRLDLHAAHREIICGAFARLSIVDPRLAERVALHYAEQRKHGDRMLPGAAKALARLRVRVPKLGLVTNGAARPLTGST